MKTVLLLTVASLAAVLGAKQPSTEDVKTEAAAGRYGRRPSYGGGGYGGGGYPSYGPGYWQPLVQDRFVCDLDASVLLVVDSNRHHHRRHQGSYYGNPTVPANRAVRVKCSEVANADEDSCNLCCQQTARRDTTLANDKLFGFFAIVKTDDDKTFTRTKRGARDDDDDDDSSDEDRDGGRFHKVDPTYVGEANWAPEKFRSNVKCVCCAPRTQPAAQNPSGYNNGPAPAAPPTNTGYNTANTFQQPQSVSAAQPLVDSWQQADSAAANWGAAASDSSVAGPPAVTPAPVANTY